MDYFIVNADSSQNADFDQFQADIKNEQESFESNPEILDDFQCGIDEFLSGSSTMGEYMSHMNYLDDVFGPDLQIKEESNSEEMFSQPISQFSDPENLVVDPIGDELMMPHLEMIPPVRIFQSNVDTEVELVPPVQVAEPEVVKPNVPVEKIVVKKGRKRGPRKLAKEVEDMRPEVEEKFLPPPPIPIEQLVVKKKQKKEPRTYVKEADKDKEYYEKRKRNTEAARKCRDKIRQEKEVVVGRLQYLEFQTPKLQKKITQLEKKLLEAEDLIENLKQILVINKIPLPPQANSN